MLEKKAEGDEWRDVEMMAMAACAFSGKGTGEELVRRAVEMLCKVGYQLGGWISFGIRIRMLTRSFDGSRFKTTLFRDSTLTWGLLDCSWIRL